MEWLGAMFKGIGDTFTAGANVDQAKFAVEQANRDRELQLYAFGEIDRANKIGFLAQDAKAEQSIILIAFAFAAIVIGLVIYKSK